MVPSKVSRQRKGGAALRKGGQECLYSTGHNIEAHEGLSAWVIGSVESALSRISAGITRVEIHLSDENSDKKVGHGTMRCVLEARLEGHQPVAVTHQAATLDDAVDGAADQLVKLIENTLGRLHEQESNRTDPDPSPLEPEPEQES